jgi:hypothetical protein
MNNALHTLVSGSIAIALAVFTVLSAAFAGFEAFTTVLGISLLAMHGLVEITILSYAPSASMSRDLRRTLAESSARTTAIAFPNAGNRRQAA